MKEVRLNLLNILDEPKIPLDNYLLKLVDKKDGVGNSLYLYNVEKFVKDMWDEIIQMNGNIIVRKFLPKELGIDVSAFYGVKNGKRGVSIQQLYKLLRLWKKLCNKSDDEKNKKWRDVFQSDFSIASFSKPIKVVLPKFVTPKLAYLCGLIVGDGCFDSASNKERIKISEKNKKQLELITKPLAENILGIECHIRKDNPGPCLRIFSKAVYRFFRNVLEIKVGEIPEMVFGLDNVNKSFFIRGLFDAEGDLDANYLRSRIRISQNSKKFLKELILLMKSVDIFANGPYGPNFGSKNGVCYNIEIRKKSEILKFRQNIGTSHLEKSKRLEILTNEIKNKYTKVQSLGIQK